MSRTLSTNSGSLDSLKVSTRCGCRPNAPQMRCTVVADRPVARAIERRLQWVAFSGTVSSVFVTTSATLSSPILRGAPGRGSSESPSSPWSAKRRRQVPTVSRATSSFSAIAVLLNPSAAKSTIRARRAAPCDDLRRRTRPSSSCRSVSLRTIATALPHAMAAPGSITRGAQNHRPIAMTSNV